ncbi:hypothetical protein [Alkalibacillus silvisoli]|uniref:DUF2802 domain-containing protein n=1 Tax=Alkalibacillus silvisoli TaxID=392823 RepID=A0ABP3JLP2_9BACI
MIYVLLTLLVTSIVLLVISFFMSNRFNELEQEIEQLSMSQIQEQYVIKNKLKVLEEELLTDTLDLSVSSDLSTPGHTDTHPTQYKGNRKEPAVVVKVKELYEQGYSDQEIESQTGLSQNDIKVIIQQKTNNEAFA